LLVRSCSFIITLFSIVLPKFKVIQQLIDRLNLVLRENLSGMLVVRAFNKQRYEENRFDKANLDVTDNQIFIGRAMSFVFPLMNLVMLGGQVLIIAVGARFVAQSSLQVGNLIAFMQYSMQIFFSFMHLSMLFIFIPRAAVSGARIADVLETPIVITDPQEPKVLGHLSGDWWSFMMSISDTRMPRKMYCTISASGQNLVR
jgi:ATP-binding cassette subfamily B protein